MSVDGRHRLLAWPDRFSSSFFRIFFFSSFSLFVRQKSYLTSSKSEKLFALVEEAFQYVLIACEMCSSPCLDWNTNGEKIDYRSQSILAVQFLISPSVMPHTHTTLTLTKNFLLFFYFQNCFVKIKKRPGLANEGKKTKNKRKLKTSWKIHPSREENVVVIVGLSLFGTKRD